MSGILEGAVEAPEIAHALRSYGISQGDVGAVTGGERPGCTRVGLITDSS
jgi:hypothetical protein